MHKVTNIIISIYQNCQFFKIKFKKLEKRYFDLCGINLYLAISMLQELFKNASLPILTI